MSLLSYQEIIDSVKSGAICIEPFSEELVGPDSVDIRLADTLLVAEKTNTTIDPRNPQSFFKEVKIPKDGFVLKPQAFVLGATLEKIGLGQNIAAQIEGRSSLGRLGIMVHVTAGIVHAGYGMCKPSRLTLEIYSVNPNPVLLVPGMKIAQLSFFTLKNETTKPYDKKRGSKYIGQEKPMPARAEHENEER